MRSPVDEFAKGYRNGVEDTWKFLCQRAVINEEDLKGIEKHLGVTAEGAKELRRIWEAYQ